MYSKREASKLKQDFWTRFGQYMRPVPSASGEKVNWANYKTGVPHVFFRLDADKAGASVAIQLTHPQPEQRQLQYRQLLSLKNLFYQHLGEEWVWKENFSGEEQRLISRVAITSDALNVFNEADWPQLISFLKARIMALDAFWTEVKPAFEQ